MSFLRRFLGGLSGKRPKPTRDPSEVAEVVVAQLKALAQPCLRVVAGGTGNSRLGGVPDLSAPWPRYEGRPLSCVAQLDLAELRAAGGPDWLPAQGRLMFFYELEHGSWGLETSDAGSAVVIYEAGKADPAAQPADLPEDGVFPFHQVSFFLDSSTPPEERIEVDWKGMTKAENFKVEAAIEALQPNEPVHQIGGFPQPVQADEMEAQCERVTQGLHPNTTAAGESLTDWRLLFQIDTDNDAGMMWGDTGMLYFWVREQDARAGDFSRIWMILQCC